MPEPNRKGNSKKPPTTWSTFQQLLILGLLNVSVAWTTLPAAQWRREHRRDSFCINGRYRSVLHSTPGAEGPNERNDDDAVLSDLDARVLQSMLQDEKLNLQEEQNMKRLLERGIKNNEPVAQEAKKKAKEKEQAEEEQYASQILKTLGDTKLWKGLSRNAADWFESAKIWVENKVERDTKLVASLGFFAFERALQDVKRALPAASAAASKVAPKFLLDTTTSNSQNQSSRDIRNQMTTPRDEIKSVTQEIKLIIQSGGERGPRALGSSGGIVPTNSRGLQSTATSKQGKDRFLKAYQRRKQTTLRRERENLAQTGARMAGNVMDSAYQVRRELQSEPNQPGYKTKALREGAAQTSRMLASGAKGFLSGARAVAQSALPSSSVASSSSLSSQDGSRGGMAATDAAMNAAMGITPMKPQAKKPIITSYIDATIVDASVVDRVSAPPPTPRTGAANAPINTRIPGTSSINVGSSPPARSQTEIAKKTPSGSGSAQRPTLVAEEEELFFASRGAPDYQTQQQEEQTISSLLKNKGAVGGQEAKTPKANRFAYFTADPSEATRAFTVDQTRQKDQATANEDDDSGSPSTLSEAVASAMPDYVDVTPEILEAVLESQALKGGVASEALVDPAYTGEILFDDDEDDYEDEIYLDDEDPQDTLRRVMAEIVTDEDFESAVGSAKRVDNTAGQEVDDLEQDKEPALLVVFLLRVLDVLFLVLEKVILAIPSLLSALPRVASRYAEIQNAGAGSEGWETIVNAQRGEKRY